MRNIFALILLLGAFSASAQIETEASEIVYGYGRSTGFCNANDYFCVQTIKRYAEQDAERDGAMNCRIRGGTLDSWSGSCRDFCTPFNVPPQGGWVSCDMNCTYRCQVPDHNRIEDQ